MRAPKKKEKKNGTTARMGGAKGARGAATKRMKKGAR